MRAGRGGWPSRRASLRLARRSVARAKGRSALIAVLVGLPVLLATAVSVAVLTSRVDGSERVQRDLGAAAARITADGRAPMIQNPDADNAFPAPQAEPGPAGAPAAATPRPADVDRPYPRRELQALTGGRLVPATEGSAMLSTPRGGLQAAVLEVELRDPVTRGLARLAQGRLPSGPGEIVVSAGLHERGLGLGSTTGATTGAAPAGRLAVVGIAAGKELRVYASPGAVLAPAAAATSYLLERRAPVTWSQVRELNRVGLVVESRAVLLDPPSADQVAAEARVANGADQAVAVIAIGTVLLLVVLLAGPAFAVGVRRQRRDLALLAATGAARRHLSRIVFAQALVLGAGAAALGAALGIGAGALTARGLERWSPLEMGPVRISWLLVAVATGLGALAALLAATVPAGQAGRLPVIEALAGRRGEVTSPRGLPQAGLGLIAAGAFVALWLGRSAGGEFKVVLGTAVMILGTIMVLPAAIGRVAELGRRAPLPIRLALRDSARQRSRTVPAVAAVMASVAAVTALAIGGASDARQGVLDYEVRQPMGVTTVQASAGVAAGGWKAMDRVTRETLPGRSLLTLGTLGDRRGGLSLYAAPPGCPAQPAADVYALSGPCRPAWIDSRRASYDDRIATPDAFAALGYRFTAAQRDVLARGGVLLADGRAIGPDGTATVSVLAPGPDPARGPQSVLTRRLPAAALDPPVLDARSAPDVIGALLTPATTDRLKQPWSADQAVLTGGTGAIDPDQEGRWTEALGGVVADASVYTERGPRDDSLIIMLILGIAGGIAVLVATLTATALAVTDARPDLATMAAIGAPRRLTRRVAAGHALVIGLFGAITGLLVGAVPGLAVTWPLTTNAQDGSGASRTWPVVDIPWLLLLALVVLVPLTGALGTLLATRGRISLVRRMA